MTTVPHQGEDGTPVVGLSRQDTIRSFARAYMGQGWHCLLLSSDSSGGKVPPKNCPECDHRGERYVRHDPATCGHLTCHGFYAATADSDKFDRMLLALPGGHLAVRTGVVSRLVVIDAEANARPGEPSGLEVLDYWEMHTGTYLPETLTARSVSGGLHKFYRCHEALTSGRILPGVDLKAEAGYVGAVSGLPEGRSWLDSSAKVADLPDEVISWLGRRRLASTNGVGRGGGAPDGYDFARFLRDGCPGGHRDYFINDLAFRLRMRGLGKDRYVEELREAFAKLAQPPDADYEMPWEDVLYKAERVWATREPVRLTETQRKWVGTWKPDEGEDEAIPITRIGTKSIVRRPGSVGGWK